MVFYFTVLCYKFQRSHPGLNVPGIGKNGHSTASQLTQVPAQFFSVLPLQVNVDLSHQEA